MLKRSGRFDFVDLRAFRPSFTDRHAAQRHKLGRIADITFLKQFSHAIPSLFRVLKKL